MSRLTQHHAYWPEGLPLSVQATAEDAPSRRLLAAADTQPDKVAVVYYGREISYAELRDAVLGLVTYLHRHAGVGTGDRVLILMQNSPQFIIAYHAVLLAGAVVVAINPMSSPKEVAYYVEDSGARLAIVMQEMLPKVRPLLDHGDLTACLVGAYGEMVGIAQDIPFVRIPPVILAPRDASRRCGEHEFSLGMTTTPEPLPDPAAQDDLAVIGYTSGTTGQPKGAMLTHYAVTMAAVQRARWLNDEGDGSDLLVLPMCHIAGMSAMNQALVQGRTMVLLSRWDAAAVPRLIERYRVGRWGAVAPMLIDLLALPDLKEYDLSSLRRLYIGATATPLALADDLQRLLGLAPIECYGMTETCGSTHINPPRKPRRGSVGIPQIDVDARVIDVKSLLEIGCRQPGEIVIHCPTQFIGYWNNPEATREAFMDIEGKSFVRTGDIGYFDEDGFFYITDRIKRMINACGLKIWPSEIESCLSLHPAIQEVCVIPARDPHRGETVKALIVLKPDVKRTFSPEDIIEWARTRLAAYKIPRLVEFVSELPKTLSGKVTWRVLQERQARADRTK